MLLGDAEKSGVEFLTVHCEMRKYEKFFHETHGSIELLSKQTIGLLIMMQMSSSV